MGTLDTVLNYDYRFRECEVVNILKIIEYCDRSFSFTGEKETDLQQIPLPSENKNSSTLQISSISYDDSGLYVCIADNGIEQSIKTNFTLTIRGMDLFEYYPLNTILCT